MIYSKFHPIRIIVFLDISNRMVFIACMTHVFGHIDK